MSQNSKELEELNQSSSANMSESLRDTNDDIKFLSSRYNSTELYRQLQKFGLKSKSLSLPRIQKTYKKLRQEIILYDNQQELNLSKEFSIEFLEHSHYIYSLMKEESSMTQEDLNMIESRKQQFDESDYPPSEIYLVLLKFLSFLSQLMAKWGLFDIYNYNYRYKGRSLTVKIINMDNVNMQYLAPDIIWFSFAINHQPFLKKIDNDVLSSGGILQNEINRAIQFFRENDLSGTDFEVFSKWKFYKKTDLKVMELYKILKSVEVAYRYFEKHLIQVFIKFT